MDERQRQSIRLDAEIWLAIDECRKMRPGNVSRNTWIAEAILAKLSDELQQDNRAGAPIDA